MRFPILRSRQHLLGGNLSGGEQQMLAVSSVDDAAKAVDAG
jgi:ABC-type branched-subunit amino acid transport system ATPase component